MLFMWREKDLAWSLMANCTHFAFIASLKICSAVEASVYVPPTTSARVFLLNVLRANRGGRLSSAMPSRVINLSISRIMSTR